MQSAIPVQMHAYHTVICLFLFRQIGMQFQDTACLPENLSERFALVYERIDIFMLQPGKNTGTSRRTGRAAEALRTAGRIQAVWETASKDSTIPGRAQWSEEDISRFRARTSAGVRLQDTVLPPRIVGRCRNIW